MRAHTCSTRRQSRRCGQRLGPLRALFALPPLVSPAGTSWLAPKAKPGGKPAQSARQTWKRSDEARRVGADRVRRQLIGTYVHFEDLPMRHKCHACKKKFRTEGAL